jgi:18S rRNA (guanine1575-N7)-methyltransferase
MITKAALKAGFSGGVVVDFPNSSKNKKLYLCIDAGGSG